MVSLVEPVLHRYCGKEPASREEESPEQIELSPKILEVGFGLTVMVLEAVPVQPLLLVTVTL